VGAQRRDGSVEAVIAGELQAVDAMIRLPAGPRSARVDAVEMEVTTRARLPCASW
jgi:acylphosphatase